MTELDNHELLAEFARSGSESAFATLVARHVNLVYSTAVRVTGNPHHAEEISQAVFIILARKAGKLSPRIVLSGWLYQVARFTALNFVKGEIRRQRREQEAYMQTTSNELEAGNWEQIAPLLDEAMGQLSETDRNAVVLRFFENKTAVEMSSELKLTGTAAHKRMSRALEKLRRFLAKRGVNSTTAIIAGAISSNSVQAAPAGLTKTILAVAIAKSAAVSGSTLALVKGALKMVAYAKVKTAVAVGAAVLLAAVSITITVKKIENSFAANPDRWRSADLNLQTLEQLPPQVRILPSTFSGPGRRGIRGPGNGSDRKMVGLGFGVPALFASAYGKNDARIIFDTEVPTNRCDFICTLSSNQGAALQNELRKEFGLAGKLEVREMNVLLLTVKNTQAGGLRPSAVPSNSQASFFARRGDISGENVAIQNLANDLEQHLGIPIIDQTGMESRRFDFELTWDQSAPMLNIAGLKQALSDELGLELIPARKPTEMVVIDKAKP
jgi:RNA polymerase sigma factor (sigma-70 family)